MKIGLSGNPANLPELAFTHGGRFHADDVFSTALLRLLRRDIRVHRGFAVPKNFSGIVYDIGCGEFDHHQRNTPKRENGQPYAAFGLLWKKYGKYFFNGQEWIDAFDKNFIQPMDLDDNRGTGHVIGVLIGAFNPVWDDENADTDEAFFEAVEIAYQLLGHRLASMAASERGLGHVREALKTMENGLVILPQFIPWKPVLIDSPAEFVVFPTERSGYSLQCIPREMKEKTGHKVPLPSAWYGLTGAELQQVCGVADATFCHHSGFMCAVGSLAGAKQLVQKAKENYALKTAQVRSNAKAADGRG